jgi:hypothetical protein
MRLGTRRGAGITFEAICLGVITALLLLSAFNVIHLH